MILHLVQRSKLTWSLIAIASVAGGFGCGTDDDDDDGGGAGKSGSSGYSGFGGTSGKGGAGAGRGGNGGKSGGPAQAGTSSEAGRGGAASQGGEAGQGGTPTEGGEAGEAGRPGGGEAGQPASGSGGGAGEAGAGGSGNATPTVTLTGASELVLDCGATYSELGATALDLEDGELAVTITGADAIVTAEPGRFEVAYSATDADGKVGRATRAVNICGPSCGDLGKTPIDLTGWTPILYEQDSQPDAAWTLIEDGFGVSQTVNADASILLADFDATNLSVEGVWRMNNSSDDDFVGFVFGYQDPSHFYLFDWKGATQNYQDSIANVGMTLKIVSFAEPLVLSGASYPVDFSEFWSSADTPNVTTIEQDGAPLHNDIPWEFDEDYTFIFEFHPGSFKIVVEDSSGAELESWSVTDSTYTDGGFGFYNYSQGPVEYRSFTERPTPPACSTVEP